MSDKPASPAPIPWERGFPPGSYYPGMEEEWEVYLTAGGWPWCRRKASATTIDPDGGRP